MRHLLGERNHKSLRSLFLLAGRRDPRRKRQPARAKVFAQSATVQVSEAFGAITVATDGSRDIGQIAATVPANYSAHEFNRSKYWAAKTELALRNESLPAAYAVNDDCKVTITVC